MRVQGPSVINRLRAWRNDSACLGEKEGKNQINKHESKKAWVMRMEDYIFLKKHDKSGVYKNIESST